jgi:hypothetical protein
VVSLPKTDLALVLRSEFADAAGWTELCRLIEAPYEDGFRAYVAFINDPLLAGKTLDELMAIVGRGPYRSFFFVADRDAITNPEHPILVVDVHEKPGRAFRVIPRHAWSVENNLTLANMEFSDFADNADPDGVFRGFRDS